VDTRSTETTAIRGAMRRASLCVIHQIGYRDSGNGCAGERSECTEEYPALHPSDRMGV
jgi:hypothetical protein